MDLRETFGARLHTAHRAACRRAGTDRVTEPGEIDLDDIAANGRCALIGADLSSAKAAVATLPAQTRHAALHLSVRASVRSRTASRRLDARAAARGVDVRGVYDSWSLGPEFRAALTDFDHQYLREGCVTQPLILLDRRAVVLDGPPLPGGDQRTTWLVGDPEVVRMAGGLFDATWRSARPIASARPGDELTDRQRQLIPLLLAGCSEAAIAREVGVAERTVSSDVRALMTALGATGRVDLGYRLRTIEESVAR